MNEWIIDSIGNLAKINAAAIDRKFNYETIEYIDTSSVTKGVFDAPQILNTKEAPSRAKRIVKQNDIIISTVRPNLQHFGLIQNPKPNTIVSTGYAVISPQSIDAKFLYYYLSSDFATNFLSLIAENQTSAYPSFNPELIRRLKISFPKSEEKQEAISSLLSAYDDLIEVNNQRIKILEETASQLYKEWFVRMRFPGYQKAKFEKGFSTSNGEIKYFKDFIKLNRGFDLPETKIIEGPYPVIGSTSIKSYHNQFKIKAPIITTGRSGSLGTVLYTNQDGWALNTSLYVKDFKGNHPLFVYYFLKSMNLESFDAGAGVPTLNQNHLHKLKLWVPDEKLQKKYATIVQPIFDQMDNLNQQNNQLRQIRDRLLPRLISGKLQVKTQEIEIPLSIAAEEQEVYNPKL